MRCSFEECSCENDDTCLVTVDDGGYRYFCLHHWKFVSFLFNTLVNRCRHCERNHIAEIDKDVIWVYTIKHDGKYYDLCINHLSLYEEFVGSIYNFIPEFED